MGKRKSRNWHHWTGLTPDPDNFFGFVYIIHNMVNQKKYVGKKQYWASNSRVKSKCTDRTSQKWNPNHWKPNNWKKYTGSSKRLNEDIKKHGRDSFVYEIVGQYESKGALHYGEIELQVKLDVLRKRIEGSDEREYYNGHIAAIKFIPPERHSKETRERIKQVIAERGHPMQGKVHPNKGKSLPQTGHRKNRGRVGYTDGTSNIKILPDETPPKGWWRGMTKKGYTKSTKQRESSLKALGVAHQRAEERYKESPKRCNWCGTALPYGKSKRRSCSDECRVNLIKHGIPKERRNDNE